MAVLYFIKPLRNALTTRNISAQRPGGSDFTPSEHPVTLASDWGLWFAPLFSLSPVCDKYD